MQPAQVLGACLGGGVGSGDITCCWIVPVQPFAAERSRRHIRHTHDGILTSLAPRRHDTVSERLRRWTRNPLGSARRGSNPLGVVCNLCAHLSRRGCVEADGREEGGPHAPRLSSFAKLEKLKADQQRFMDEFSKRRPGPAICPCGKLSPENVARE